MPIKLTDILFEIIDLYKPEELHEYGIDYSIISESKRRFMVNIKYNDWYYQLLILPMFNPKRLAINFGDTNSEYKQLNLSKLLNVPHSNKILACIFGLLRYFVDKYDINSFEYGADGTTRTRIYEYYLTKHFLDFIDSTETWNNHKIYVWTKE